MMHEQLITEIISFCKSMASIKMLSVKIIKKKLLRAPQFVTMCWNDYMTSFPDESLISNKDAPAPVRCTEGVWAG